MLCGRERCLVGGAAASAVVGVCGGVEAADYGGSGKGGEEGERGGEGGTEGWLEGHGGLEWLSTRLCIAAWHRVLRTR